MWISAVIKVNIYQFKFSLKTLINSFFFLSKHRLSQEETKAVRNRNSPKLAESFSGSFSFYSAFEKAAGKAESSNLYCYLGKTICGRELYTYSSNIQCMDRAILHLGEDNMGNNSLELPMLRAKSHVRSQPQ